MIFIILPAYNEEKAIGRVCEGLSEVMEQYKLPFKLVVVDDGSKDNTPQILESLKKRFPLLIITHKKNKGLGEALKSGFEATLKLANPKDILVTMDCDNTHPVNLIPKMVEVLDEGADIVIASRYQKSSKVFGVPSQRAFLSTIASILFRLILPISGVKDYTCGFRAYRAKILKQGVAVYGKNFISQKGFVVQVEILLKLSKLNVKVKEIPIILRYDRKKGRSKMNVGRTIMSTCVLLIKQRFYLK